jgi:Lamin Tail Domain/CARDB
VRKFVLILLSAPMIYAQTINSSTGADSLILSEIMFNPEGSNTEFVELYNTSKTQSIDLNKYQIKYYTANPDTIFSAGNGTILQPESFAVIFEDDYDFTNGIYKNLIPSKALILKISDHSFGSNGMANTSDRTLLLISSGGDTLDTHTYSANNDKGISDERVFMNKDSLGWKNSTFINGTPGKRNSVTPYDYDLAVSSISFSPQYPLINKNVSIETEIKNTGLNSAQNFEVDFYNDKNGNLKPETGELFYAKTISNLPANDSLKVNASFSSSSAGSFNIIAKVNYPDDEHSANNTKMTVLKIYNEKNNYNNLVVNEIMYAPAGDEPEWVELYNRTANKINLKSWYISDNSKQVKITDQDAYINPNSFLVISKDSAIKSIYRIPVKIIITGFPILNNSGDAVVIKDSLETLIDSVRYYPSWGGNNGSSLERISANAASNSSSNWGTSKSINHATPGEINSLTPKDYNLGVCHSWEKHKIYF